MSNLNREQLAKAMCESRWKVTPGEWRWDRISKPNQKMWLESADAVLALVNPALKEARAEGWDEAVASGHIQETENFISVQHDPNPHR